MKNFRRNTTPGARGAGWSGVTILGFLLFSVLPGTAMAGEPGSAWQISTVENYSPGTPFLSFAYDKGGVPHVAYQRNVTNTLTHAWLEGDKWQAEIVSPSGGTFLTSLAIDPAGNPCISYGSKLSFGNLIFAKKSNGDWTTTLVSSGSMGTFGDAGEYSSLAFDQQGIPHIAYNDGQIFADLYYASLNQSSGKWDLMLIDNDTPRTGDTGYSASLKFDHKNVPHIAYIGGHPWSLRYATLDEGRNWVLSQVDTVEQRNWVTRTYTGLSMALDSHGIPHISYYNQTTTHFNSVALYHTFWNGTGWSRETVAVMPPTTPRPPRPDDDWNPFELNPPNDRWTSIALDTQDVVHISYGDVTNHALKYATRSPGGVWDIQTVDSGAADVFRQPFLAFSPTGNPGIAYHWNETTVRFAQMVG